MAFLFFLRSFLDLLALRLEISSPFFPAFSILDADLGCMPPSIRSRFSPPHCFEESSMHKMNGHTEKKSELKNGTIEFREAANCVQTIFWCWSAHQELIAFLSYFIQNWPDCCGILIGCRLRVKCNVACHHLIPDLHV